MGYWNIYADVLIGGVAMSKILYALLILLLFIVGIAGIFYGLYIFWKPLAYIVGGFIFIGMAGILNQSYDNTSNGKGGEN